MMSHKEDSTFVDKMFEVEKQEWCRLSTSLRQHGLPAVDIVHPDHVSRFSEVVIVTSSMAKTLRQTLTTLIRDMDRRQELVQEMIITSNRLREELKAQALTSVRNEDEVRKLRSMMAESSNMLQESYVGSREDDGERIQLFKLQAKCDQLRQKCDLLEQEVARLTAKNERFVHEEQERRQRENDVFEHLRKKPGKQNIDETILSIIDSYERQIYELKQQIENNDEADGQTATECTPNFKSLIRAYERNMRDLKKKLKGVEDQYEMAKLELQSRPQLKDVREFQLKVKQLERVVKTLKVKQSQSLDVTSENFSSTLISDIDFMHSSRCRTYLKLFCEALNVVDLDDVTPKLQKLVRSGDAYSQLEQFAKEILQIVDSPDVPKPAGFRVPSSKNHEHEVWCEKSWKRVLPTLDYWMLQLRHLKELQLSIRRMMDKLFPWHRIECSESEVTTAELIEVIDSLLCDDFTCEQPQAKGMAKGNEMETRAMLQGIVGHFQKLFDVPNVIGVYARMSDIYRKLSETHNILRTLKDFLGLDESTKSSAVVDAVAELCRAHSGDLEQELADLLQVDNNADSIVSKIQEYQEFFTAFHDVMAELMSLLGATQIDQVIPAVQGLVKAL